MEGTIQPHTAVNIATICVGMFLVYFGFKRIVALIDKDDHEWIWWLHWRFISGVGCVVLSVFGFVILMAMTNEANVIAFCRGNELNPVAVLLVLFLLSVASAVLNGFLPKPEPRSYWTVRKSQTNRP